METILPIGHAMGAGKYTGLLTLHNAAIHRTKACSPGAWSENRCTKTDCISEFYNIQFNYKLIGKFKLFRKFNKIDEIQQTISI